eukprot:GEMP01002765.1.p1 GENE.GEMP01002765.1~~GEMP01002765.1.p1  ORF type:complete len:1222 (+),score=349.15 GEMP01002765.1:172-3837(+)
MPPSPNSQRSKSTRKKKTKKEEAVSSMHSEQSASQFASGAESSERTNEQARIGREFSPNVMDSAMTAEFAGDSHGGDISGFNFTFQPPRYAVGRSGVGERLNGSGVDATHGTFDTTEVRRDADVQMSKPVDRSTGSSPHHTARFHEGAVRQQQHATSDHGSARTLDAPVVQVGEIHEEIPVHAYVDKNTVHVRHECRVTEEHQNVVEIVKEKILEKTIEHVRPIIDERVVHMPKYVDVPIVEKVQKVVDVPKRIERDVIIEEPTVQTIDEFEYYPVIRTEKKFIDLPRVVKSYTVVDKPIVEEEEEIIEVPQHEVVEHIDEIPILHKVPKYVEVPRVVKIQKFVDVRSAGELEHIVKVPMFVKTTPVVHRQEHVVHVPRVEVVDKIVEMPETRKFTKFMHYKEKRVELPKEEHVTVVDYDRVDAVHLGTERIIEREYAHEIERGEELSPIRREHHVWGAPLNPNVNNPPLPPSYDAADPPPTAIRNVMDMAPQHSGVPMMPQHPLVPWRQEFQAGSRAVGALAEHIPLMGTQKLRGVPRVALPPVQAQVRYVSPRGGGAPVSPSTLVPLSGGGVPNALMGLVPPGSLITPEGPFLSHTNIPSNQHPTTPAWSFAARAPLNSPQYVAHAPAAPAQLIEPGAPPLVIASAREAPAAPPPVSAAPGGTPVTYVNHSFYGHMVENNGLTVPVIVDNVPTIVRPVGSEAPYVEASCWPSLQHLKQQLHMRQQQQLIELQHTQQGALDAQQVACIGAHFQRQEQELEQYVSAGQGRQEQQAQQGLSPMPQMQAQQQQALSSMPQQQEFFDHMRLQHQQLQLQERHQALLQAPMMQATATRMQLEYLQELQNQQERMAQQRELQELRQEHEAKLRKLQKQSRTKNDDNTIIEAEEQNLAKRVQQLERKQRRQIAELKELQQEKNQQQEEDQGQLRSELSELQQYTYNEPPSVTSVYNSSFTPQQQPSTYNVSSYSSSAPQQPTYNSGNYSLAPSNNYTSMSYPSIIPPAPRERARPVQKKSGRARKRTRKKSIVLSENDSAYSQSTGYSGQHRSRSTSRTRSLKAMRYMTELPHRHSPEPYRQSQPLKAQRYRRAVEQWYQSINRPPHTSAGSFLGGLPAFQQQQQQLPSFGSSLFASAPNFGGGNDMFSRAQQQQEQARNVRFDPQFASFQSYGNRLTPAPPMQQNNPWARVEQQQQSTVGNLNSWNTVGSNVSAANAWGGFGRQWG